MPTASSARLRWRRRAERSQGLSARSGSCRRTSSAVAADQEPSIPQRQPKEESPVFVKAINPILNVSDIQASFAWFGRLGWKRLWDWGDPPGFGAVGSGNCEIFLCQGGQGGRGRSPIRETFGPGGDQTADKGVWMSLWVEDV